MVLTGRATISVERRRAPLTEIVVGHVEPAWFKAKRLGKCHVDRRSGAARHRLLL